jgi:hypothetical protein
VNPQEADKRITQSQCRLLQNVSAERRSLRDYVLDPIELVDANHCVDLNLLSITANDVAQLTDDGLRYIIYINSSK